MKYCDIGVLRTIIFIPNFENEKRGRLTMQSNMVLRFSYSLKLQPFTLNLHIFSVMHHEVDLHGFKNHYRFTGSFNRRSVACFNLAQ